MKTSVTKFFHFSASHAVGTRVLGRNYILEITLDAVPPGREAEFEKRVARDLIKPLESRDLGLHVDFLRGVEITDRNLLETFWVVVKKAAPGFTLRSMALQRDATTKTTLIP